jgi:hypothetical protein
MKVETDKGIFTGTFGIRVVRLNAIATGRRGNTKGGTGGNGGATGGGGASSLSSSSSLSSLSSFGISGCELRKN